MNRDWLGVQCTALWGRRSRECIGFISFYTPMPFLIGPTQPAIPPSLHFLEQEAKVQEHSLCLWIAISLCPTRNVLAYDIRGSLVFKHLEP